MATTLQTERKRISPAVGRLILLIGLNRLDYIDHYILPDEVHPVQM